MEEKEAEAGPVIGTIFLVLLYYIRTDPITLPCSLARAGKNCGPSKSEIKSQ